MKHPDMLTLLDEAIYEYRSNRQWGTAHVYRAASRSFTSYLCSDTLSPSALTPALLKGYESHLRERGLRWNTVATYMKVLKAIYHRAVDRGLTPFVPRLFHCVRTAPVAESRRALEACNMRRLLTPVFQDAQPGKTPESPVYRRTRTLFALMFFLRGIPFVDLIYLRKCDLHDGVLQYRRRKTGRPLAVRLTPEALELIRLLQSEPGARRSPYLLPLLSREEGTEESYREYQSILRCFNRHLKKLPGQPSGLSLSSYTARHTWATAAYRCEVHPGVISEAMGHSSIAVTETYLKPFRDGRIDRANRQVIDFVMGRPSGKKPRERLSFIEK